MHTIDSLKKDLESLGLKPEDTVMIHSSMRRIGDVENRADGVLDALSSYFAPGLIALPTLTYDIVNDKQPIYSANDSPCCTGILPELFRKRPNVVRSLSPTHSLAALGKDAADFTAGHEQFDSPAPRQSPWGRLYDRNAKIVFIGCSISHNTFLHSVEEWLPVPGMLTESRQNLIIIDQSGRRIPRPMRRHVGGHSTWYAQAEPLFYSVGALHTGTFGDAPVHVIDARKAGDAVYALLKNCPLYFTKEHQDARDALK